MKNRLLLKSNFFKLLEETYIFINKCKRFNVFNPDLVLAKIKYRGHIHICVDFSNSESNVRVGL